MSNYYRTKKIVLNKLNDIIESSKKTQTPVDLNALRLQFCLNFEIGELSINKMVQSLAKYHEFKVIDDNIEWD